MPRAHDEKRHRLHDASDGERDRVRVVGRKAARELGVRPRVHVARERERV